MECSELVLSCIEQLAFARPVKQASNKRLWATKEQVEYGSGRRGWCHCWWWTGRYGIVIVVWWLLFLCFGFANMTLSSNKLDIVLPIHITLSHHFVHRMHLRPLHLPRRPLHHHPRQKPLLGSSCHHLPHCQLSRSQSDHGKYNFLRLKWSIYF